MCTVLKEIYYEVYGSNFSYQSLDNRIELQKAVYFLENMGVSVGDYSFSWDKYGPYSLSLDSDAQRCSNTEAQSVVFSDSAKKIFSKIKSWLNQRHSYSITRWVECIASLHYLQYVRGIQGETLLHDLIAQKPYLNDDQANRRAIAIIKEIRVGD